MTFLHGLQTHLFLPSSPLSSYGTSLPRLAPNLHFHAGTALTTKQGAGSVPALVPVPWHSQPHSPVHCSALTPASLAAALSHLGQATLGTSWNLARCQSEAAQEDVLAQEALTTQDQLNLQANKT